VTGNGKGIGKGKGIVKLYEADSDTGQTRAGIFRAGSIALRVNFLRR
jgi:hypothetical protein